uniref:Ig-like domain-containing protein n=1 Tax=Neogobius melanostomus TaxID=47308 RepID=A0A8C6SJT3_9GOBI
MSYCLLGLTSGAGVLPHDPVDAAVGDTVMFTTSLDPTQTPLNFTSILWKFGSKDIITSADTNITAPEYEGRITLFVSTGSLQLRNVTMSDAGEYNVTITMDTDLILIMYSPTEMISDALVSSSTQLPEEGTSLNVTCDASGSVSTREWMKNGSPLNSSENIIFYHQNQVLCFRSLSRKDSGRYSCNISNPVSSQEDTYYMVVTCMYYGPENVEMSGSKEVQVQTAFRLSCSAESVPAASYVWIKNGTIIADSFEFTENLSEFSDSGEYICRATNDITMKTSEREALASSQTCTNALLSSCTFRACAHVSENEHCNWTVRGAKRSALPQSANKVHKTSAKRSPPLKHSLTHSSCRARPVHIHI